MVTTHQHAALKPVVACEATGFVVTSTSCTELFACIDTACMSMEPGAAAVCDAKLLATVFQQRSGIKKGCRFRIESCLLCTPYATVGIDYPPPDMATMHLPVVCDLSLHGLPQMLPSLL